MTEKILSVRQKKAELTRKLEQTRRFLRTFWLFRDENVSTQEQVSQDSEERFAYLLRTAVFQSLELMFRYGPNVMPDELATEELILTTLVALRVMHIILEGKVPLNREVEADVAWWKENRDELA